MIDPRRAQLTFGDKLIAEEVDGLYEEWMAHADGVLGDEGIVMAAYEALAERHRLSRTRGRRGFSAEVVVRLLVLKHENQRGFGWELDTPSAGDFERVSVPSSDCDALRDLLTSAVDTCGPLLPGSQLSMPGGEGRASTDRAGARRRPRSP